MRSVSDEEVDFILSDIKARGVVLEDLQYNLLDHICCIVENEMTESEDFNTFYEFILPRFFKTELKEIQEEVDLLLKFKNYYAMKKILKITGAVAALLMLLGAIFKTMHWPGAGVIAVLAGVSFSFIFLPLLIALKFKDEENTVDKWVLSFGLLLAIAVSIGIIIKLMHWPYGGMLMVGGLVLFIFGYVPLYFFTRIRRPELQFNTIVNSVIMICCGGLLFAMMNLGYGEKPISDPNEKTNHDVENVQVQPD